MKNNIFVDLDETLIHTFNSTSLGSAPWGDEMDRMPWHMPGEVKEITLEDGIYSTVLREGAHTFLKLLRQKGNVFMLTAATKDYALAMNEAFGFNFNPKGILSREDVQEGGIKLRGFEPGNTYLFDNLPARENHSKIAFLRPLGKVNYVAVPEFNGEEERYFTEEVITYLLNNIVDS
jgi:hypothetical protein